MCHLILKKEALVQTRGELADMCNGKGKAGRYEQCGGVNFSGPSCCAGFNTCVMVCYLIRILCLM